MLYKQASSGVPLIFLLCIYLEDQPSAQVFVMKQPTDFRLQQNDEEEHCRVCLNSKDISKKCICWAYYYVNITEDMYNA